MLRTQLTRPNLNCALPAFSRLGLALMLALAAALPLGPNSQPRVVYAAPSLQSDALSAVALANAEYFLSDADEPILLSQGRYAQPGAPGVRLLPQWTAYGDFLGDGMDEAIVLLEISAEDAPPRYELAIVMEEEGAPYNLVTLLIGEGVLLESVAMHNGEIVVNLRESDPSLPATSSLLYTLAVTQIFVLEGDQILQYEIPGLTLEQLANMSYRGVAVSEDEITLIDGQYSDEEAQIDVSLSHDYALGDLDGDLAPDAAVLLVAISPGTGVFYDLAAVLNVEGEPRHVDTFFLGDRVGIEQLFIRDGQIVLDLITHGPDDPLCCPTVPARLAFVLTQGALVQVEIEQPVRTISAPFGPLLPAPHPDGFGYVNLAGEFIIAPQFEAAFPFAEGLAAVALPGENFGYIDVRGEFVIEPQFSFAGDFQQGIAVVEPADEANAGNRQTYINRRGERLFDGATFAAATPFAEGLAAVRSAEGLFGYINRVGELVIEPRFDSADAFNGGLARVSLNGQFGFINRSGGLSIAAQFAQAGTFSEGLAPIELFGQFGYISLLGDLVIGPQFERASAFHSGLALVTLDGLQLYIDPTGNVMTPEIAIEQGGAFAEGLAAVTVDGLMGYIDQSGALVIAPQFLGASGFENGMAVVQTATSWGVIDATGRWLLHLPTQ